MLVRCKKCNKEISSTSKIQCCGCPNQMVVRDETVSAVDLSQVVLLDSKKNLKKTGLLSNDDLKYQENRRKRKVRKLNFETR
jgi:hypothetical protein